MDVKQGVLCHRVQLVLSRRLRCAATLTTEGGGQLLVGLMASARGDRGTGSVMAFRTFTLSASTLCQCSCRWCLHEERGHARCDSRFSLSTSTLCDRSSRWRRVDGFNMGGSGHGSCVITFHTFSRERCATTLREAEDEGGSVGGGRGGGREEIEWVYMGTLRDGSRIPSVFQASRHGQPMVICVGVYAGGNVQE